MSLCLCSELNSKWSYFIVSKLIVIMLRRDKNVDNRKDHMYKKQ